MADQTDHGNAIVCGQLNVGLSAVIGLTNIPGQCPPVLLRYLSGGTLEIVGTGGTQVGSGFTGILPSVAVGSGFQMRSGDPAISVNTDGTIFFISSGATSIVSFIQHRSADYS